MLGNEGPTVPHAILTANNVLAASMNIQLDLPRPSELHLMAQTHEVHHVMKCNVPEQLQLMVKCNTVILSEVTREKCKQSLQR